MAVSDFELLQAWTQVLQLSNLRAGETVSILTSEDSNEQNRRIALMAAQQLGGIVTEIRLPPINAARSLSRDKTAYVGKTALAGNKPAIAALQTSGLVIDLMLLLFSPEQLQILESGARILLAVEPPEVLVRLLPTPDDRRRVLAAARTLRAAKTMRVESSAGTDLTCRLGEFPVLTEYGYADEAGRWDHWPSGFVATWANERSAHGTIVLDRGDIILPFKNYIQSPIRLSIEDGYIIGIEGSYDAEFLKSYFRSFNDPEVYAISHIGWGLQPRAEWTTLGLYDKEATLGMDARSFYGNFLFSTGPNNEAGGTRNTPCHIDIPMRHCSVSLDGEAMTQNGVVVPAEQRCDVHLSQNPHL
jgi:2,5-dihydroxypyridine 5,6-dioxygenase